VTRRVRAWHKALMPWRLTWLVALVALPPVLWLLGSADGASARAPAPTPPAPVAPPPPPPVVPYDSALLRLAEIMGALHFLQQLCEGEGTSAWRDQMTALLDAEQPDNQRRVRLIDRFNRGFESYRSVYRACTDSARLAMSRYQQEGSTIATDVGARYGRGG
jgi:uncharacterized protein (TIGR02301 family)